MSMPQIPREFLHLLLPSESRSTLANIISKLMASVHPFSANTSHFAHYL